MKYHEVIIDLIHYILNQPEAYIDRLDSGNAYDKILRNYHQFNYEGEKVYRNKKRIKEYYRFTKQAWRSGRLAANLYYEHLIPVAIMKKN